MSLENQFQDIRLTETEYKRLARNIHRRYANTRDVGKKDYTYLDLKGLFANTGVGKELSTEIINKELARIKPKCMGGTYKKEKRVKKEKIKKFFQSIGDWFSLNSDEIKAWSLVVVVVGGIALFPGLIIGQAIKETNFQNKFNEKYRTALVRYADYNTDGTISKEEITTFNYSLLKGRGIIYGGEDILNRDTRLKYVTGDSVNNEDMLKWIEGYKPKE